jgi:hypothetical protein
LGFALGELCSQKSEGPWTASVVVRFLLTTSMAVPSFHFKTLQPAAARPPTAARPSRCTASYNPVAWGFRWVCGGEGVLHSLVTEINECGCHSP